MEILLGAGGTPARHRMNALLERWDTCRDRRALFLKHWLQTTDSVLRAVRNRRFRDSQWALALLEELSQHYFITVEPLGDDLSRVTPPAWHAAHEAALSTTPISTCVLLGVNAAISNDMPQAAATVLHQEWPLSAIRLERRYQDFRIMCDIIGAGTANGGQLVAAWLDDVWPHALMLLTAADVRWREVIRGCIELTAARRAHLIACDIERSGPLLMLPAERLDHLFPARHDSAECRLRAPLPSWGVPATAGI